MRSELTDILKAAVERRASDVHFTAGIPPQMRVDGEWLDNPGNVLSPADCKDVALQFLGDERMRVFLEQQEHDSSHSIKGVGRFRVNVFFQRGSVGVAVRVLPYEIPEFNSLGLPESTMADLCELPHGLVLVCGPTGSGKSTTLASMVSHINRHFKRHIVTIEDPVEYMHRHVRSIVEQREIGSDSASFAAAMRHVLRQSPDVVLVGEIRDAESVRTALMIAETGHLMLTTIHTGEVAQGLSRIVDMFPSHQLRDVRVSLSLVLRGMLVQQLLPGLKRRRVLACEIMLSNPAMCNLIREGKFEQIHTQIHTRRESGMMTMNGALAQLCLAGEISEETALSKSTNVQELKALL